jgi:hypothetical protein
MVHGGSTLWALNNWPKGKPIPSFIPKGGFEEQKPLTDQGPVPAAIRQERNGYGPGWSKKECTTPCHSKKPKTSTSEGTSSRA